MCELEQQMKSFKEALTSHTATVEEIKGASQGGGQGYTEEGWIKLSQVRVIIF